MPEFNWITTGAIIAGVLAFVLGLVAYLILAERKVSAWMQNRLGPNRVGPFGLIQPIADGAKLFLKEDIIPAHVDRVFYLMAPAIAMGTALFAIVVVPWGGTTPPPGPMPVALVVSHGGLATERHGKALENYDAAQAAYKSQFQGVIAPGLDIGVLVVFAVGSLAVYGVILGGWSANSKYSLLGAIRSSAQIISYEIPLGMSVVGVLLYSGSLNLESVIGWQKANGWFVLYQPLAFLLFMTSVFAECNRLPFDLPEAEQELVGGYHTEYSSLKFGMFFLAEYTHMITTSFLMSVVFCGGWTLFGLEDAVSDPVWGAVVKAAILVGKMSSFILLFLLVRWTIPRFRFDQLMDLAWKVMIPLALLHLLAAVCVRQFDLPNWALTLLSVGLFVGAGAIGVARQTRPNNAPRRRVLPTAAPAGAATPVGV